MNKAKAWLLAARPRTLTASISPVLVGCALAYHNGSFDIMMVVMCLCVALFAQIASNFANDYFDFRKGADGEKRLGPSRAVASGWITPVDMLIGTVVMLMLAFAAGFYVIFNTSWLLLLLGIAIGLCVLAYSAGPFPLAYNGLGDVCVLLFYGVVPVFFTYYVIAGEYSTLAFILALSLGFLSINIFVVNNYRDYEEDKSNNKRTTIVLFGRRFVEVFYLANGIMALILAAAVFWEKKWLLIFYAAFAGLFLYTWREMKILEGKALNKVLGHPARNGFIFALLLTASILLSQ